MATKKNVKTTGKATKKQSRVKTWKDISGHMKLYGNVFTKGNKSWMSYSTSVSTQDEDGEWTNLYFNVRFRRDEDPAVEGAFDIKIKSGFLTLSQSKDGSLYPCVMVLDWEAVEAEEDGEDDE